MKNAVVLTFLCIGLVIFFTGTSRGQPEAQRYHYNGYRESPNTTKEQNFQKALELMGQKKKNEALDILKKLYDQEIKPFDMALHLAHLYIQLKQYGKALNIYEKFKKQHRFTLKRLGNPAKKNVTYSHFYFNLGTIYLKLDRYGDGIDALKKVLKSHNYRTPNRKIENTGIFSTQTPTEFYSTVHYQLGLAYLKLGDKKNAVKQYRRLKDLDEERSEKLKVQIASR